MYVFPLQLMQFCCSTLDCTRLMCRVRAMLVTVPPIVVDRTILGLKIPLQLQGRAEPHISVRSAAMINSGLHSTAVLT